MKPNHDPSAYIPYVMPSVLHGENRRMPMPIMEFKGFNDMLRYEQWREWCAQQRIAKAQGKRKAPKRDSGA